MLEFMCAVCGKEMEVNVKYQGNYIIVQPCETCIDREYERGLKDGREQGWGD